MTNPPIPAVRCNTMADIRREIDRLDCALVALLAERQSYIERAAKVKTARSAVHDQARIDDVVAKVLVAAKEKGLSAAIAEPVWRIWSTAASPTSSRRSTGLLSRRDNRG